MSRFLTKSRFKLACECETKLFYTRKNKEYADQSVDDPFLIELAKGGYQVGELAKYYFTDKAKEITVESKDYEGSLAETNKRIKNGDRFIAEAAILHENLFIRVDIFEIDQSLKTINLFEVKSKSYSFSDDFYTRKRGSDEITGINSSWKGYLLDVAFQKYVVERAFPSYTVNAFLTLVNKDATATVDGLNQLFKVKGSSGNYQILVSQNITKEKLGKQILINIPVDKHIYYIWSKPVESIIFKNYSFENYIKVLAQKYKDDEKIETPVSKACRKCQFYTKPEDENNGLRSGIKECWMQKLKISEKKFNEPRITELSYLYAGKLQENLIEKNKYFISDIDEVDIFDKPDNERRGLGYKERRWKQVEKVQKGDTAFYLDKEGLKNEMESWKYPLHFIDFETASPALPFTKDAHPYEGIAFQFSHHTVDKTKDGNYIIKHESQFINIEQGVNPNLDFIMRLMNDLSKDNGTIFRYHNHENTYLRMIYSQIEDRTDINDKKKLMDFIDSITQHKPDGKNYVYGERSMVDLWKLVVDFYYSPHAKGSTSLKKILPAAIHDSGFLKNKYSKPICGKGKEVSSLNFDSQVWIDKNYNFDPYKTLPKVFEDYTREELDEMFDDMDELADGGAAMMAYAKLQFFETKEEQRQTITEALFKYCELDTLAMVMLWEFWNNEINK